MSEEQLKAFWEAVQTDTSLQEKLRATTDADSIASIAKETGFEITAEEVEEAQSELSEEELKGVAGGFSSSYRTIGGAKGRPKRDETAGPLTFACTDKRPKRDETAGPLTFACTD